MSFIVITPNLGCEMNYSILTAKVDRSGFGYDYLIIANPSLPLAHLCVNFSRICVIFSPGRQS